MGATFQVHPYAAPDGPEGREYQALGEAAFMDRKWHQFEMAVRAAPEDFARRVGQRFLAATLWYVPLDRPGEASRPWSLWRSRSTHPLPFLSLGLLVLAALWCPPRRAQWLVIGLYAVFLLPYIGVCYYERYAFPLLGVKVLLVTWAGSLVASLCSRATASPGVALSG